ncbi:MAG TPA: DEAD/DEAH box helicase [Pirellulales bacterium]|nr:DEAD/DEAH box helicase [Pirellulales bacterium]
MNALHPAALAEPGWSWRLADQPRPEVLSAGSLIIAAPAEDPATSDLFAEARWRASAPPGVVSLPLAPPRLKTTTFVFPLAQPHAEPVAPRLDQQKAVPPSASAPSASQPLTRIKPPSDIVKLEDRLYYVLQPPLEAIVGRALLHFPFQPFHYQLEGVAFLYPRYAAILADEMGLGKTMQAITAIRLLVHAGELRRVLLVCPKPLVTNWQREFQLWSPELPLTVVEGDPAKRRWQWQLADAPIKIANYELLHRDRELLTAPGMHFDLVVLDESQRIKNRSSSTSQIVRAIPRSRNWALTGTPVENSPEDLVGIFEFLSPGYLTPQMKPRRMGKLAGDYVLRRTKDRVLTELPPKMFRDADVSLTSEQRETYRLAEDDGVLRLTNMGEAATIQHVFELVLRLKQICNFDPATGASSKLERLEADLEEIAASGQKALVFSQWVTTLDELGRRLRRFCPLAYHGGVPSRRRDDVIREFKEGRDRPLLLISYGAGSVGLNLQFAGYVFLFDRWWNPAVEDQAINRVHRIGAAGPVTVTRFLALGTIEERINQILEEKREIFDTIFSDTEPHKHAGLTRQEIFGLFQLRCPSGPLDLAA